LWWHEENLTGLSVNPLRHCRWITGWRFLGVKTPGLEFGIFPRAFAWSVSCRAVTRAKGPAHISLGQRPGNAPVRTPKATPGANGAAQIPKFLSAGGLFHILPTNHSRMLQSLSRWTALSALWRRPSDSPARWAGLVWRAPSTHRDWLVPQRRPSQLTPNFPNPV